MNNELAARIYDATVSIDGIWPIPFCYPSETLIEAFEYQDRLPAPLNDLIANWRDEEKDSLFGGRGGGIDAWEELSASISRKGLTGYVCKASHPVYQKSGSGASFSWGHTRFGFFFGPTAEAVLETVCEWAEKAFSDVIEEEAGQ